MLRREPSWQQDNIIDDSGNDSAISRHLATYSSTIDDPAKNSRYKPAPKKPPDKKTDKDPDKNGNEGWERRCLLSQAAWLRIWLDGHVVDLRWIFGLEG